MTVETGAALAFPVFPLKPWPGSVLYVAGPISGNEEYNIRESARISRSLLSQGFGVIDAAQIEHDGISGKPVPGYAWHDYMNDDIRKGLMQATAICLRPQWPYSRGALAELNIAASIGLDVYFWLEDIQGIIPMGELL